MAKTVKKPPSKFELLMRWRGRQMLKAKTMQDKRRVFAQLFAESMVHAVNKPLPRKKKKKKESILEQAHTFFGTKLWDDLVWHLRSRTVADWMVFEPALMEFPLESIWDQFEPRIKEILSNPEGQDDPWLEDPPPRPADR